MSFDNSRSLKSESHCGEGTCVFRDLQQVSVGTQNRCPPELKQRPLSVTEAAGGKLLNKLDSKNH
jgi:hypothetical protein